MKTNILFTTALGALLSSMNLPAADAPQGKVVKTIHWNEVPLPKGTTLSGDGTAVVAVHAESKPVLFSLLKLEQPGVHTKAYGLRCKVRYSEVEGAGYLEMWNVFPPQEGAKDDLRAFTRTMGNAGPMSKLTGTSEWRASFLPFNAEGAKGDVKRLEVNVYLSGKGRVEIKDVELLEFADAKEMFGELERMATTMLAPPDKPPLSPKPRWMSGTAPAVVAGAVLAAVTCAGVVIKKRRAAENRRMRAMDAA